MATSKSNSRSTYNMNTPTFYNSLDPQKNDNRIYYIYTPLVNSLTSDLKNFKSKSIVHVDSGFASLTDPDTMVTLALNNELTLEEAINIAYTIGQNYRTVLQDGVKNGISVFNGPLYTLMHLDTKAKRVYLNTVTIPNLFDMENQLREVVKLLMNDDNCYENEDAKEAKRKAEADKLNAPKRPSIVEVIEFF